MLKSEPNVRCCLFPGNKVTIKNQSSFPVCYQITVLKGAKINRCTFGISGPGGNGISGEADIKDAERLPPEYGKVEPGIPKYVTISGGTIFMIKYRYEGLHTDWSPETRNFSVCDDLVFDQPPVEEIEKLQVKRHDGEAIQRMCSSKFGHMCSAPDTPKQQCWKCHDWYCNHHFERNNNPFGKGGHICK